MSDNTNEVIEITGTVESVTFCNKLNGFCVLELGCGDELVTVVGVIPDAAAGEDLRLTGSFTFHPSFGRQFKAASCTRSLPENTAQLLKYLSAGTIKGIGEKTAQKIIREFGEHSFEVLEGQPERLAQLKGITLEKARDICAEFNRQFAMRQLMAALGTYGLSPNECMLAYKSFGGRAKELIEENPYILCSENTGIGFERADDIASRLKTQPSPSYRLKAGIVHVVKYNLHNGHTCIPRDKLLEPSAQLLETNTDTIDAAIQELTDERRLICEKLAGREFLFLPDIYKAERSTAERLKILISYPPPYRPAVSDEISGIENADGIIYEEKQRQAILTAVTKGMLILTGGPGTGKTTALKGILRLFEKDGLDVALAAPTGRAAKRMSEVTGREAKTIHRLLEVEWDERDNPVFTRNMTNPLECDALIVDELSMVDTMVFSSLIDAMPLGCRLIMVGDSDQLPPVGAGNVLHDMIDSGILPVVRLDRVFRQAMQSLIVTNAHKIVNGELPVLERTDADFFHMEKPAPSVAAQTVVSLCSERLPKAYGWSVFSEVQVLCPSRKGETGTVRLNRELQQVLNPHSPDKKEVNVNGQLFREGDKIMQIKNDYNIQWEKADGEKGTGVFNGDVGRLVSIDLANGLLETDFDGRRAVYAAESIGELELAYAITVHKSQGSEFEAVVFPCTGVAPQLCYRNLLYTAVTRAKAMLITVGSASLIASMTANNKKSRRYSALKYFLTE
ncbi:MAG: ATP-dependent RecD-like DNA helicase [Clostridiales bacterium]|nr:ATP-dependent RecD-like DNA helicase [Clostridiales bacterium]